MGAWHDNYFLQLGGETATLQLNRQIITVFNLYRLVLALILLISYYYRSNTSPLGSVDPELFLRLTISYAIFNLATLLIPARLQETLNGQLYFASIILTDIVVLEMLSYASGGFSSGITPLLILPVASGSLLFGIRISTFFAAIASIALIFGEFYHFLSVPLSEEYYVQTGLLGLLLFITALGIQTVGARIREKDLINRRQAISIQALQQINEQIIQRMHAGIVVLDQEETVLHCNDAARNFLAIPKEETTALTIPAILHEQLQSWLHHPENRQVKFRLSNQSPEIQANFTYLQTGNSVNILIFLENYSELSSRAQHLKLMSLGRLTASIAHEIRNPLGAISHAAQLLSESPQLRRDETRLLGIIHTHSLRMNKIIQNVLELSRHKIADTEKIELGTWLLRFAERLKTSYKHPIQCLVVVPSEPVWIRFNPSQLEQLLTNLCDNGLRYSLKFTGEAAVTLELGVNATNALAWLDVIDDGPGVDARDEEQIFEPFYTTENSGTGLGLFICKELCEANQSQLFFQRTADGRSAFRLNFGHPDRQTI
jgi:two-component system, NtrC family, sensor histidine kinase PilS